MFWVFIRLCFHGASFIVELIMINLPYGNDNIENSVSDFYNFYRLLKSITDKNCLQKSMHHGNTALL